MFLETFREETQRMREAKAVVSSKLVRSSSVINRPTFRSAASFSFVSRNLYLILYQ